MVLAQFDSGVKQRVKGDCILVEVLALDGRRAALGLDGVGHDTLVAQLSGLGLQRPLGGLGAAVVKLAMLRPDDAVLVLLRQDLSVVHGLDSAVVVVLVDFLVDGSLDLLVPGRLDRLVPDLWTDLSLDGGVVMPGLGRNLLDSMLGGLHDDRCWNL